MTTHGPFTFDTQGGADALAWTFTSPGDVSGLASAGTGRRWSHETDDSASVDVGPTSGQGGNPDGYVYTEMSSGGAFGDVFTMEFGTSLDALAEQWQLNFYTNQRGDDNDVTCDVQINEDGGGWVTIATFGGAPDPNKVALGGADVWVSRSVDLSESGANANSSTLVRLQLTAPASGTAWHNDYGIDTIEIVGSPLASDPSISDVDGDEFILPAQTNVVITGTNFEASQGAGSVEIGNNSVYASATRVTQSIDSWSDTSIQFDTNITGLAEGTLWLFVTDDNGDRNDPGHQITVSDTVIPSIINIDTDNAVSYTHLTLPTIYSV